MTRKDLETQIRAILTRVTEIDVSHVGLDEDLPEATGIDSLGRLEALSEMEEAFELTIYDLDSDKISTIGGMIDLVEAELLEAV